ncbi:disease resistance protein RPV1-like [Telopea speciosissima]|uniref:disease resistance protein RPV1-like n=1 Tax=Telopea speciosissima TaxID=54955 RepID=UPI001CC56AF7|nr:disease resistance protein RPV1-like [Telopea speciosissima]
MAAHQASSGTSYEVFLSFCGKDVRTNFADHLYHALDGAGIRTFRDEEELHKGNEIAPELIAAIQQSRVSIPIFSINFASSKWCLNELTEVSECRRTMDQIVLPIFYKVEPRDVRNQTGAYEKAFEEHQMRFDETTVQKWKKALRENGELDGWHSKEDTYEGKLVKEVVKTVWSTLNKRLLHVSNKLVGIQTHIKKMLMLLDIESDDRKIVGIHGLSGIGKTTVARAVYDTVLSRFGGCTFIENVRENAKKHGIHYLQNKLIKDILKQENQNITSVDNGINVIRERLCRRKVLIVLDDVDQDIQAESLVGDREWFGIGSKIILTSTNKDILIARKADGIYEPNVMDLDDSLELFSHHAFGRNKPIEDYLDLSKAMVKITGGLPLAIQVIGSSLFSKKRSVWEGMLKKLQKVPNNDIMKRLKLSYDGLEDAEQQMFLDIACFFIGMNKIIACHIWEGCDFSPQVGLDVLCAKSLVMISEDGKLRMHDMLRDLGRDIVRQESIKKPGERSRIWSQEEVLDVLVKQAGTSNCEGLTIDFSQLSIDFCSRSNSQCLMSEGLAAMTELRLLQLDYAQSSGNFTNSFSELRWLSWRGCPDQYALTNFCPQKLAVLDLSCSKIEKNWMGWDCIKMAVNLKVLNLMSCDQLSSTPDVTANRLLEVLILKDCKKLEKIDTSICCLMNLVRLDMSGCVSLIELPEKLDLVIKLTTLDLSGCIKLKSLPSVPQLLEVLILSGCRNLVRIDTSVGCLRNLITLDMRDCSSLVDLPIKICRLASLLKFDINGCGNLALLPNLPSGLKSFDASNCVLLRSLPMLSSLKNLEKLRLPGCKKLLHILGLPSSLIALDARHCESMVKLSSTSQGLRNLKALHLDYCTSLEEIEGVDEKLDSLVSISISRCRSLKKLPNLKASKNLRTLKLNRNNIISDFEGEGMDSLEVLEIESFQSLRKIPYMRDSKRLRILQIKDCPELSEIECLEDFEYLQTLSIIEATSLKTLPDISTLKNLSYLRIRCCNSMERLPDLSNLKKLWQLEIVDCMKLTEIPGLDHLESLGELKIGGCISIQRLPDLSNLKRLNALREVGY